MHITQTLTLVHQPSTTLQDVDKDDRVAVLRTALEGGAADLPG